MQRRIAKKMSRNRLAAGICSPNAVQKIELYGTIPRFDTLAKLLAKLNCSIDEVWQEANVENYSEYTTIRKEIAYYNKKHNYIHVEHLINGIDPEIYNSLPLDEQQYLLYNQAAVLLKVHGKTDEACTVAENALELTLIAEGDRFSENEMLLINLITSIRQNDYFWYLLKKAYIYYLNDRINIADKTYMTIANGMLQYYFKNQEWQKLLEVSIETEEDGLEEDMLMYVTNIWFSKGVALYKLNSCDKGREYIKNAMEHCLLLKQMRNYNYFQQHLVNLGINIKE
ncbi:helix-turn-helix domain-containing protein [Culicoidibacter larvae]|nr:helix-turn-helix transcriptional regulator [Culicoidibacter larvae]